MSLWSKLFGCGCETSGCKDDFHRYEARYDGSAHSEHPYVYVRDICVDCGKTVERDGVVSVYSPSVTRTTDWQFVRNTEAGS